MTNRDEDDLDLELDLELDDAEPGAATADASSGAAEQPGLGLGGTPGASGASTPPSASTTDAITGLVAGAAGGSAGAASTQPTDPQAAPTAAAEPATSSTEGAELDGQWVWQFAAPPPPPPFSATFFSGRALAELYWFFASGLLVLVGCLLPWGPSLAWLVEQGESTVGYTAPPAGYALPIGAICLALALWLILAACYGIYTGRQKILPVFLMLIPFEVTWVRALDAWGALGAVEGIGFTLRLERWFEVAGTGVLLAMIGSTIITVQLVVVILKVMRKKPAAEGKGAARARKADKKEPKSEKKPKADRKGKRGPSEGAEAGDEAAGKGGPDEGSDKGKRRGRKR